MSEATQILCALEDGDVEAAEQLLPLVYDELRQLAAKKMAHEMPVQTLSSTALVHEAYPRLVGANVHTKCKGRVHFFAAAAEAMRRILIDNARRKRSLKRGGDWQRVQLDPLEVAARQRDEELLELDEALEKLASIAPQKAELVKLRYFAGFSTAEAACHLDISISTAERHWAYARAWLHQEISK
jgi:RNA polymerase sigma factor (TIGR02999 family)